jgi:hypothetical protein
MPMVLRQMIMLRFFSCQPAIDERYRGQKRQDCDEDAYSDGSRGVVCDPVSVLIDHDATVHHLETVKGKESSKCKYSEAGGQFHLGYDPRNSTKGQDPRTGDSSPMHRTRVGRHSPLKQRETGWVHRIVD